MFSPCVPGRKKKAGLARLYFIPKDVDRNERQKAWGGGSSLWQVTIEQGFVRQRNVVSPTGKAFPTPPAVGTMRTSRARQYSPKSRVMHLKEKSFKFVFIFKL